MRYVFGAIGLIGCVLGFWLAYRTGQARLLVNDRKDAALFSATGEAIRLSPFDPEVHYARAMVLWRMRRFPDAVRSYEQVVKLRPRDYVPWLDLGSARERAGDKVGALAAYENSVQLSPHYALPRRELGKVLLELGRTDDGFAQLRLASRSNPTFLREVIEKAWETYGGDANAVRNAIQPQNDVSRVALADFFTRVGVMDHALELMKSVNGAVADKRYLMMVELIEARRYADAANLWRLGGESVEKAVINDGGFETGGFLPGGFGWQIIPQLDGSQIVLDKRISETGKNSLRLDFEGNTNSETQFVRQLVLLEERTRYQLSFSIRTEDLVSGGLPLAVVTEASTQGTLLGKSNVVPSGTSDWQTYSLEFETTKETEAAFITIQRQRCGEATCPIFGRLWLDNFSLTKLGAVEPRQSIT